MDEKVYKTTVSPILPDTPLAVLVDGGTASSSEITSGALQDLDRAVILGSRSFGKGLVQSTRQLPYDGLLKLTIAKYYIPSGRLGTGHRLFAPQCRRKCAAHTRLPHHRVSHRRRSRGARRWRHHPDSLVEYPEVSRLTFNVVRDGPGLQLCHPLCCYPSVDSSRRGVCDHRQYLQRLQGIDRS